LRLRLKWPRGGCGHYKRLRISRPGNGDEEQGKAMLKCLKDARLCVGNLKIWPRAPLKKDFKKLKSKKLILCLILNRHYQKIDRAY